MNGIKIPKGIIDQLNSTPKGFYENMTEEDLIKGILKMCSKSSKKK